MNKLYIFFLFLILSNCSFKPVINHHGVPFLEKKQEQLILNKSNKNDIKKILGVPSSISKFDNDVWIYIERKQSQSNLKNLGRMKLITNNVLVLEVNKYGILEKKDFYNKNDMRKIKSVDDVTGVDIRKNSFIYNFFSSMRQKINDPLNKRVSNRNKISQR